MKFKTLLCILRKFLSTVVVITSTSFASMLGSTLGNSFILFFVSITNAMMVFVVIRVIPIVHIYYNFLLALFVTSNFLGEKQPNITQLSFSIHQKSQ